MLIFYPVVGTLFIKCSRFPILFSNEMKQTTNDDTPVFFRSTFGLGTLAPRDFYLFAVQFKKKTYSKPTIFLTVFIVSAFCYGQQSMLIHFSKYRVL